MPMRSLVLSISMTAIVFANLACDPKTDAVDERQQQVQKANASLSRIDTLDSDLRAIGLSVDHPDSSRRSIMLMKNEAELLSAKKKLEDFVTEATNVIAISQRPDVMWGGKRDELESRVAAARTLLIQVNRRLDKTSQFGAGFWSSWDQCRAESLNGIELGNGRRWYSHNSFDESAIAGMSPERRREIAKRLRRQIDCDRIVDRGYQVMYDADIQAETPRPLRGNTSRLEAIVQKLENTPDLNSEKQ